MNDERFGVSDPKGVNSKQISNLHLSSEIEKERKNESKYVAMFVDLLKTRYDLMRHVTTNTHLDDHEKYKTETSVLKNFISIERQAFLSGLIFGSIVFVSIRKLPYFAIRLIGGDAKLKKLHEVEVASSRAPDANLRRMGAFLFESSFSVWAGYRGYDKTLSMKSEEVYVDLANIPLCPGLSRVSDSLCDEWINLTYNQIPKSFWSNLQESKSVLKNHLILSAMYSFAENCVKRKVYENQLRPCGCKNETILIPNPGVPKDILNDYKLDADLVIASVKKSL